MENCTRLLSDSEHWCILYDSISLLRDQIVIIHHLSIEGFFHGPGKHHSPQADHDFLKSY